MNILDALKVGITNGTFSIREVEGAMCDGIKRHYGVENLYFSRGYEPGTTMDGYFGSFNMGNTGVRSIDNMHLFGAIWMCSVAPYERSAPITSPDVLSSVLDDFHNRKISMFFIDTGRSYDRLIELTGDYWTMRLSGMIPSPPEGET